jgi:broad specificity phosphatase PhoE
MPTRLTLICDGATAATRVAAFPRDEPLEDRALSRAAVLGHGLRRADRALTSLALRARQTAALSLDALCILLCETATTGAGQGAGLLTSKRKSQMASPLGFPTPMLGSTAVSR